MTESSITSTEKPSILSLKDSDGPSATNSLSNPGPFQSTPASGYQDRQIGSVGRPVEYNDKVSIWFVGRVQHAMGRIFGKSESQPVSIIALSRMKGWYPNKLSSTCSQWVHPILCKVSNYLNFPIS